MFVTRGFTDDTIITRGFDGVGIIIDFIREVIRLTSELTFLFTGSSALTFLFTGDSAIKPVITKTSTIDLETD